jgi:hypothetical protein
MLKESTDCVLFSHKQEGRNPIQIYVDYPIVSMAGFKLAQPTLQMKFTAALSTYWSNSTKQIQSRNCVTAWRNILTGLVVVGQMSDGARTCLHSKIVCAHEKTNCNRRILFIHLEFFQRMKTDVNVKSMFRLCCNWKTRVIFFVELVTMRLQRNEDEVSKYPRER